MKSVSGKELARIVEHHVRLSIPIHANRPLKAGLLRHLLKLAELPEDEL